MKKRKILVSLALASACLFSLAACGKTEEPTPTPTATATTTTTTTTTNDSLAVTFKARYSDGTPEEELTALAKSVKSGEKVAKPADPVKDGYNFLGFETANGAAFNFDNAITAATTVYAYFDKVTAYHTFVQGENVIENNNFNTTTVDTDVDDLDNLSDTSLDGGQVVFEGKKMKVICAAKTASGAKQDGQATYAPAEEITNSIIKGTFAFNISRVDTLNFVDFLGDSKFQIGAKKVTVDGAEKYVFRYTGGASADDDVEIVPDTEYTLEFELNQLTGKMTIKIEGTETKVKDLNVANYLTTFKGIAFGSTKGAEAVLYVDNLAVSSVYGELADVKTASKAALTKKLTALETSDKITGVINDTAWAPVATAKTDGDAAIEAATTAAEADAAYKAAVTAMNTAVDKVREDAKTSAKTWLTAYKFTDTDGNAYKDDYAALDADGKAAADAALATIKTKYATDTTGEFDKAKNVKELKAAYDKFIEEMDKIFYIKITFKYYTAAGEPLKENNANVTKSKGYKSETVLTTANIETVDGYKILGLYTDDTLSTAYTAAVTAEANVFVKVEKEVTVNLKAYDGTQYADGKYTGTDWVVQNSAGNQKISTVVGKTKDDADANAKDVCKIGKKDASTPYDYILSKSFESANKISLTMKSASTGTSEGIDVLVELLTYDSATEEYTVVKSYKWENVTKDKKLTEVTCEIESTTAFNYVRITKPTKHGKTDDSNFGVLSITGKVYPVSQ